MKRYAENRLTAYKTSNCGMPGRLIAWLLPVLIIAILIFVDTSIIFAEVASEEAPAQTSAAASEGVSLSAAGDAFSDDALAGEGSGQDVTIRFGKGKNRSISIHVNRETGDGTGDTGVWDLADPDNTEYLHVTADASVTEQEQERNASFKLTFTYSLAEEVVHAIDEYNGNPTFVYDLTEALTGNSPLEDAIPDSMLGVISIGSRKLGTYKIVNNKVYLEFTDPSYFDGRSTITGWFTLTVVTNESQLGNKDEWTYTFPGTSDTIPVHYKKTTEKGSKSVYTIKDNDGNYTLHYTADIHVNAVLDSMTFHDTLGGLQELDASSVKIDGTAVTVSQTGHEFSFDVASALGTTGVAKGSYKVTYDTKVTAAQLEAMTSDKTTETNKATWTVNGNKEVPGGETSIEINKPVPPIPVKKSITPGTGTSQPGDTLTYTVTYGDAHTSLAGFHISDTITDVVIPQGNSVTLQYGNGRTVSVPFGSQATDGNYSKGMVTLFDYTFPSDAQGTGPVAVTYSVKLIDAETAKQNGVYDRTVVDNIAKEHRQNTTDQEQTTVIYEKEPRYEVTKTAEANPKDSNGNWRPGSVITYTLTIGDGDTNMAGVNIKDVMTDLQVLQGDIMIRVGNGSPIMLGNYVPGAVKWSDDGKYQPVDVELFDFNMPSNAGNGPVVITYQTKVISQGQASANQIYGDMTIRNVGTGGNQSQVTHGITHFDPYPIRKTVTQAEEDVNGSIVDMGSTVHYTLTFGDATMNLGKALIFDEMTDLQRLVSDVTIKKADGTTFKMPTGSWTWADDGVVWNYFDDEKYSLQMVRVFQYRLPADIGYGPVTVEYDAQIIGEEEANELGLKGTQTAWNTFLANGQTAQTNIKIEFPTDAAHKPDIKKAWAGFDVQNNIVYWNITVEKEAGSAYPIENITVAEVLNDIHITEPSQGYNNDSGGRGFFGSDFDMVHAIVTTDDGTVLTPGTDYTIDKESAKFTFPVLNERVHIRLAFKSPAKIVDGYKITNTIEMENPYKRVSAPAEYHNPHVDLYKDGEYSEETRLIKWTVVLNPSQKLYPQEKEGDPVWFTDTLPEGLTIVNYKSHSPENPTVNVSYGGSGGWSVWLDNIEKPVTVYENNVIRADVSHKNFWKPYVGLSGEKIEISYYTLLPEEEWDRITSSASGSETYENHVTITAGDGQSFEATGQVTVTSDEYLTKTDTTQQPNGIVVGDITDPNLDTFASKNISYRIEINPNGYRMNNGNDLSLTDYISTNMDLDTSSVRLYHAQMGDDGKLIQGEEVPTKDIISYNDDSRLLSLTNIPDETPMILVYQAAARSQGEDTYRNTATLIGGGSHSASTNEKHTVQVNDAGISVDGIIMNLHKIDENNVTKDLKGAKFQLYECVLKAGDLTDPAYNQAYWDELLGVVNRISAGTATQEEITRINTEFKIVRYDKVGEPVVTGENGYTQWSGLREHRLYAWKEIEAPEEYTGNADYHYFVAYQHLDVNHEPPKLLPVEDQTARKHAAWALDDACQYANNIQVASMANMTTWTVTNVHSPYTSISAEKVWKGDSNNLFETRPEDGIKLQLVQISPDGTRTNIGSPVSINVDDNGSWPVHIWNRLYMYDENNPESNQTPYRYTVVEQRVDGYSTIYSDNGEGLTIGKITVTNEMIPKSTNIYVRKEFADPQKDKPAEIPVTLIQIRTDKDGNETRVVYDSTRLTESNNWEYAFTKLPTTMENVEDGKVYYLTYTVEEDTQALERLGFHYTVTYSDQGKGVIEASQEDPLIITNTEPEEPIDLTIVKVDAQDGHALTGAAFDIYRYDTADAEEYAHEVIAENASVDADGTLRLTGLKAGFYRIIETQRPAGYVKTTSDPWFEIKEENGALTVSVMEGSETVLSYSATDATLTVKNVRGVNLPATGGEGRLRICLMGIALIVLAGAGLILTRRHRQGLR